MKNIVKKAFTDSLPVLMGYVSMGTAFGILLVTQVKAAHAGTAAAMSVSTISGSMQFAAVEMLANAASYTLLLTAMLAVLINIRYAMYGISLVRYFANYPWYVRCYLVWTLTDETYALESSTTLRGKKRMYYSLLVSSFDHLYWLTGSVIGAAAGAFITFDTAGIDFAMTALFLVVLTDQCKDKLNRMAAAVGIIAAIAGRIFFSTSNMLIPAMIMMGATFIILRKKFEAMLEEKL